LQLITKIDHFFAKIEEVLLALLLVGMVLLAALQVLLRNIWDTGIDWADITVQNVTVLVGLLGAAVATSEGRHLNIDLFSRVLKGRAKTGLKIVIGLFSVFICYLLAKGGWTTYRLNYEPWVQNIPEGWTVAHNLKVQFLEGQIPQWLSQLLLPIGFVVIGFHFALRLIRDVGSLVSGKEWETKEDIGPEGDEMLDELEAKAAEEDEEEGAARRGEKGGAR
jgi:TRAP-type C4-dicarboxylate transport system permease small subunit